MSSNALEWAVYAALNAIGIWSYILNLRIGVLVSLLEFGIANQTSWVHQACHKPQGLEMVHITPYHFSTLETNELCILYIGLSEPTTNRTTEWVRLVNLIHCEPDFIILSHQILWQECAVFQLLNRKKIQKIFTPETTTSTIACTAVLNDNSKLYKHDNECIWQSMWPASNLTIRADKVTVHKASQRITVYTTKSEGCKSQIGPIKIQPISNEPRVIPWPSLQNYL